MQDYGFRIYNPAIARFLSVDPLTSNYAFYTPYQFSGNKPIRFIDLDGLEEYDPQQDPMLIARLVVTGFFEVKHAIFNTGARIFANNTRARYKRNKYGEETFETEYYPLDTKDFGKDLISAPLDVLSIYGAKPAGPTAGIIASIPRQQVIKGVRYLGESGHSYKYTKGLEADYIGEQFGKSKKFGSLARVKYLTDLERDAFEVFVKDGKLYNAAGEVINNTKKAIFVMDDQGAIFINNSPETFKFHHSSFLAGDDVASAGHILIENGKVKAITADTGHYRIDADMNKQLIDELDRRGVDTSDIKINGTGGFKE